MNSPGDFLVRAVRSLSHGHGLGRLLLDETTEAEGIAEEGRSSTWHSSRASTAVTHETAVEEIHDQVLELRYKRITCYRRVPLYDPNDLTPKCGVLACELIGKRRRDVLDFLSVEVIPKTEEAGTEGPSLATIGGAQ